MSVFTNGQLVRAVKSFGWLTEGKLYTVVDSTPELVTPNFTFPEYVVVLGDNGRRCYCYTHRFKPLE